MAIDFQEQFNTKKIQILLQKIQYTFLLFLNIKEPLKGNLFNKLKEYEKLNKIRLFGKFF